MERWRKVLAPSKSSTRDRRPVMTARSMTENDGPYLSRTFSSGRSYAMNFGNPLPARSAARRPSRMAARGVTIRSGSRSERTSSAFMSFPRGVSGRARHPPPASRGTGSPGHSASVALPPPQTPHRRVQARCLPPRSEDQGGDARRGGRPSGEPPEKGAGRRSWAAGRACFAGVPAGRLVQSHASIL